jgi:3',5'-cyclic AMP phosphodiesterase CpdA
MNRRDLIKNLGVAGLLGGLSLKGFAGIKEKKPHLRFIHMTDVHLFSDRNAPEGLAKAFRHMRDNFPDAEFIINSGDVIMDALEKDKTATQKQWDLWHEISQNENTFPLYNCIGNHDVWGGGPVHDELYGKQWAVKALKIPERYYSFDHKNWRFVVLDSTRINGNGEWYKALLDQQQFDWLAETLSDTPKTMNVMLVSHIPIISATSYFVGESDSDMKGYWHFPHSWMHGDARRIVSLLEEFPQVKGALSGHMHLVDRVDYKGVSYLCNGAISGAWWNGPNQGFAPGYAVVDLSEEGEISTHYVPYSL